MVLDKALKHRKKGNANKQMKKITSLLLSMALLFSLGTVATFADEEYRQHGEFWMLDAPMTDEITAGAAGLGDTEWKVPYLDEKPVIDGEIGETEYKRFTNFEEYLTLMAPMSGTTEDEFNEFRIQYDTFQGDNGLINAYWGWDGEYLYMAFVVQNLSGFYCNPQSSLYLFTQNCLQVGIGDEFISGNQYTELGFGVNSESGELITHTWSGDYKTQKDTDYKGHYNDESGIVTYEFRINLQETVGVHYEEDEVVSAGDYFKIAWLLSVNGKGNRPDANGQPTSGEEWQIGFCHGIGGPYSYKASEMFATMCLGAPGEDTEATETLPETEPESETDPETIPETIPETSPETVIESETAAVTVPESETVAETAPTGTTAETTPAEDGCASVLSISAGLAATTLLGAAVLLRKKKD